jgi:O-antigen/teichoic acid export membrane protein
MSSISLSAKLTRTVANSTFFSVLGTLFIYLGQVLIARELTRGDYATFSVVISFTALTAMFADLGWTPMLVRWFARAEAEVLAGSADRRGAILGTGLLIKGILALIVAVAGSATCFVLYGEQHGFLVLLASVGMFLSSRLFVFRTVMESYLRAEGGYDRVVKLGAMDAFGFVVLLILLSQTSLSLTGVLLVYTLCNLPGFLFLIGAMRSALRQTGARLSFDRALCREMFIHSLPLAVGICFITIHNNADILILRELSNEQEVSAYAASMRLMAALVFLPYVVINVFAPVYTKLLHGMEKGRAANLSSIALQYLLCAAVALALMVTATAPFAVEWVLGSKYQDASSLVAVVGWMFLPTVFAAVMTELSVAAGQPRFYSSYTIVLAVLTIACDLLFAQTYGAEGVLLARCGVILAGCAMLLIMCMRDENLRQVLLRIQWGRLALVLLLSLAIVAALTYGGLGVVFSASLATIVFIVSVLQTRLVDFAKLRGVVRAVQEGRHV